LDARKNYFLNKSQLAPSNAPRATCLLSSMLREAEKEACWKMGLMRVKISIAAIITTINMYKGDQSLPRFTQTLSQRSLG